MHNNPSGADRVTTENPGLVPLTDSSSTARYLIDPGISQFTVKALATGLLSALGHSPTIAIRDFEGEVLLPADSLTDASLHLSIGAASLAVQGQISDKDRREMEFRMKEEVLEASHFPQIVYECSSVSGEQSAPGVYVVRLNGRLVLHGIVRNQPLDARVAIMGGLLRASGNFTVRQSDYNIKPVSAIGGALKLKDELQLSFEIAARKQKQK